MAVTSILLTHPIIITISLQPDPIISRKGAYEIHIPCNVLAVQVDITLISAIQQIVFPPHHLRGIWQRQTLMA